MSPELIAIVTVAVIAFPWNQHRGVADSRECMARPEGSFEGFTRRESPSA